MNNSGDSGKRLPPVPAFAVSVGEKFIMKKKRGDPALKVLKIKMATANLDISNVNWCLYLHVSQWIVN